MTTDHTQTRQPTPRIGEALSQTEQVQDTPVVETVTDARQGRKGFPVLVVLGIGLVLAVLAGLLVGFGS